MRSTLVLSLALAFAALTAVALATDVVTAIAARDGFYRQLSVAASPSIDNLKNGTATGIAVAAVGANVNDGSATLDVAGFKFKNPSDMADGDSARGLAFYFGYLGLSGTWDSTAKTATVAGAVAEIISSWETVFAYYNNDGVAGFQWKLTADFLDCTKAAAQKYDCVDPAGVIDLKNLTWGGIVVTNTSCPSSYASPNCTVYALTTSSTDQSVSFTLRLATEPVLVNGVRIEPNYGKIDVMINYPWASKTLIDAASAKVAIVAYTAGKAGTASASYQNVDGNKAVQFAVNDKSAYFSWDSQAVLSGTAATVYADFHSGASIGAIDCSQCGIASGLFVLGLKIRAGVWETLGWKTEMLIFSWDAAKPSMVMWDPAIGMTNAPSAPATAVVPTMAVAIVALVASIANLF